MSLRRACYASLLVCVHLLGAGCSQSSEPQANTALAEQGLEPRPAPQGNGKLVLAFGDSLYAGYGLAPAESFPAQLQAALQKRGIAAEVHNAGVSGDTSAAGLSRLEFTLGGLSRKPDLAIVGLGGNDMLRGLDPAQTRSKLQAICDGLRKRNIPVVLTGMVAAPNLGRDYANNFNAIFPGVAKQCGAALYPFFLEGVIADPGLMLDDRIHPNAAGVGKIVASVEPVIARELGKKQ